MKTFSIVSAMRVNTGVRVNSIYNVICTSMCYCMNALFSNRTPTFIAFVISRTMAIVDLYAFCTLVLL